MINKKLVIFFTIIFFSIIRTEADIKINYKIGDDIITNIDILEEKKYITFLRPNLKNLPLRDLNKIAENSLIKEIIKKKEISKVFKDNNKLNFTKEIKKTLFKFKKVGSEKEFLDLLKEGNLEYEKIIEKMKYEALWNELIYQKYNSLVKIDKEELKKELINKIKKNKQYEYNLSEILFEVDKNTNLNQKYKEILNYIELNNFRAASSRYSIASSTNTAGEIGWIKETLLSSEISQILRTMKKNDISKPIEYPNGYLILKINDKKEMKKSFNIDKLLEDAIIYERNKQLSQFSLLLYKKLKNNITINEY